jgi:membrane protein
VIIFVFSLLGFLDLSNLFDWVRQQAQIFFLQQTVFQINHVVDQLEQRRVGILSFGVVFALWAASSGMRAAMKALNIVYGVKESRPLWKRYLLSLPYTVGIGSMFAIATAMVLVSPQIMREVVQQQVGFIRYLTIIWSWWLRWPIIVLLLTLAVACVYGLAPDTKRRFRFITPGAFLSVITWIITSLAFNYYVQHWAHYHFLYGSVGTIIVLLLYFFISAVILLFGAEINMAVELYAAQSGSGSLKTYALERHGVNQILH